MLQALGHLYKLMPRLSKREGLLRDALRLADENRRMEVLQHLNLLELLNTEDDNFSSSDGSDKSTGDISMDSSDLDLDLDSDLDLSSISSIDSDSDTGSRSEHHDNMFDSFDDDDALLWEMLDQGSQRWRDNLQRYIHKLESTRVLDPAPRLPRVSQLPLFELFKASDPRRFRKKLRVEPDEFDYLLSHIQDHPVFHNNSNNEQMSVAIQLAIWLIRAGHYRNLASPKDVSQWAGVSLGMVDNATKRCMLAFIALHDEAIHPPTPEEKETAMQCVEDVTCPEWRGGHMIGDGTKLELYQKPGLHGETYFDKNKDYSLDLQVCLFRR